MTSEQLLYQVISAVTHLRQEVEALRREQADSQEQLIEMVAAVAMTVYANASGRGVDMFDAQALSCTIQKFRAAKEKGLF